MSEYKKMNEIIQEIKNSNIMLSMPLGYTNGYPILTVKNARVCAVIPYLKYKVTGIKDKTEVYPIRYLVTYSVKDGVITAFEDLKENKLFAEADFSKPVGLFRHDSIKDLGKTEYKEKQAELYEMYDSFAAAMIEGGEYPAAKLKEFRALLSKMLEPSLKPFYEALYPAFCATCME